MASSTTFHLLRHGSHDRLGHILCGRMQGVLLGNAGRLEAEAAVVRLKNEMLAAVVSSPLERCSETAAMLARAHNLNVEVDDRFVELDFGDWTGLSFSALENDSRWSLWNSRRSLNRPPNGESLGEAQMRAVRGLEVLRNRFPGASVAVVSHSDIIKALAAHVLGASLDFYHRFDIDPASLTTLMIGERGARLTCLNVR